jgi:hypothetical protein
VRSGATCVVKDGRGLLCMLLRAADCPGRRLVACGAGRIGVELLGSDHTKVAHPREWRTYQNMHVTAK